AFPPPHSMYKLALFMELIIRRKSAVPPPGDYEIRRLFRLPLLLFPFLLSSCLHGPGQSRAPLPPGYVYRGNYIDVTSPRSEGWYLVNSSAAGMEFARKGVLPGETFGAQVLMFPLAPARDEKEFVELVRKGFAADIDPERFSVVESDFRFTAERGYPCVKVRYTAQDRKAQVSPSARGTLLLQAESLYCRHTVRQDTGFSIIYSHRGKEAYPNLATEAAYFFDGVQVPAAGRTQ
ncbi:MAG TPA: hypothetical protein VNX25_05890, partial [Verrucomicrobiae bacterium]|nr:hypothetical protein [Verrucomicrobiae bacterium]